MAADSNHLSRETGVNLILTEGFGSDVMKADLSEAIITGQFNVRFTEGWANREE